MAMTRQAIRPMSPQMKTRVMIAVKAEAAVAVDVAVADEVATRIETRMAVRHPLPRLRLRQAANYATSAVEAVSKVVSKAVIKVVSKAVIEVATKIAIRAVIRAANKTAVVSAVVSAARIATATVATHHRRPQLPPQPHPPLPPLLLETSRAHRTRSPFHRSRARSTAAACANSRRVSARRAAVTSEFNRSVASRNPRIAHASATLHPRRNWLHRHERP
jgi:hypothetical protein